MGKMTDALKKALAIRQGKVPPTAPETGAEELVEEPESVEVESTTQEAPQDSEEPSGFRGAAQTEPPPLPMRPGGTESSQAKSTTRSPLRTPRNLRGSEEPLRTPRNLRGSEERIPPDKRGYCVMALEHEGPSAEEFRGLKQTLLTGPGADKRHVILVTGPGTGTGKSTVAVNLALALGEKADYRVLLIDADIRKPELPEMFGLESGAGLAELLMGRAAFEEVVTSTGMNNVWVMGAGKARQNPEKLMVPKILRAMLSQLIHTFRYIVIDGPAPRVCLESAELAPVADAVLLVLRRKISGKRDVDETIRLIRNRGAEVLGCVLVDA